MNDFKPIFHITGEKGWINDPNGFSFFQGKYHIFFQHHPYSNVWGPMHWGHVVSSDLLHFEYLPIALTPGDPYDKNGCFSGSALVKDDTLYLVYTGFILVPENEEHNQQIQCLASSKDGIHFEKHGVIISSEQLPSGYKTTDFRDPKVFEKDGTFYLLACSRKKEGHGSILLFRSKDLKNWEFLNDILTHDSEGEMIECVDYDKDLNLLLYSEQNFPSESEHCLNVHACEYEVGHFDSSWKFISQGEKTLLDYGFDFYAAQCANQNQFENAAVLTAWASCPDYTYPPTDEEGWANLLTLPRVLTIEDGKLMQRPVPAAKELRGELLFEARKGTIISNTLRGLMPSSAIIELTNPDLASCELCLFADNGRRGFEISYDRNTKVLTVDRSTMINKVNEEYGSVRRIALENGLSSLEIYVDHSVVEIFINGGEYTVSSRIFPEASERVIRMGGSNIDLLIWKPVKAVEDDFVI